MSAANQEMQLLGVVDKAEGEILEAVAIEVTAAHARGYDRGYQAGLIAAGEPWVAMFAGLAGGLLGWVAHAAWLASNAG